MAACRKCTKEITLLDQNIQRIQCELVTVRKKVEVLENEFALVKVEVDNYKAGCKHVDQIEDTDNDSRPGDLKSDINNFDQIEETSFLYGSSDIRERQVANEPSEDISLYKTIWNKTVDEEVNAYHKDLALKSIHQIKVMYD